MVRKMAKMLIAKSLKIILTISALLFIGNICTCIDKQDDNLTLVKRSYNSNELRVDGYYYDKDLEGNIDIYFLFRNGILLDCGTASNSTIAQLEESFRNGSFYQGVLKYKIAWGVFHIDSNKIQFEDWEPGSGGPTPAYRSSGVILNDTTFHIMESERVDGTEKRNVDWIFYFKQFSPKPDSISPFIP